MAKILVATAISLGINLFPSIITAQGTDSPGMSAWLFPDEPLFGEQTTESLLSGKPSRWAVSGSSSGTSALSIGGVGLSYSRRNDESDRPWQLKIGYSHINPDGPDNSQDSYSASGKLFLFGIDEKFGVTGIASVSEVQDSHSQLGASISPAYVISERFSVGANLAWAQREYEDENEGSVSDFVPRLETAIGLASRVWLFADYTFDNDINTDSSFSAGLSITIGESNRVNLVVGAAKDDFYFATLTLRL